MGFQTRTITESDLGEWLDRVRMGFHHQPVAGLAEYFREIIDYDRTWGCFEGGQVWATLRSFPTEFTVPGPATVPAAALTQVTVAPSHTRQGILTEMITADLRASADRGEAVGVLIASEWPIYGRFGYGPAIYAANYKLDTRTISFRRPSEGRVEMVDLTTMRREGPTLFEHFRLGQPGSIGRSEEWWDRTTGVVEVPGDDGPKPACALYRAPSGELEGYVRYVAKSDWEDMRPRGHMDLHELVSLSERAYQALWEFCCSVDLLSTVEAGDRPVVEALPFLVTDGRGIKQTSRFDFVWVRVLDVTSALGGRRYATEGRVVVEVQDPLGIVSGRYRLDGGPDGASCARTDDEPDLTMPVDTLGSAYLGGVPFSVLQRGNRLQEHAAGAVARADLMFAADRPPWCTTWF